MSWYVENEIRAGDMAMAKRLLRFREDGTFTIVQFTDLHLSGHPASDLVRCELMERIMTAEQPDFAVLTGDAIYSPMCEDPEATFRVAVEALDRTGIPWAAIFGNHDAEAGTTKERLMEILQSFDNGYSEPGPANIHGVGNYMLPILQADGDQVAAAMYFVDTGENTEHPIGGYEWVRRDQIAWYVQQSDKLKATLGRTVPSLMFTHIPVPEFIEVWDREICYGQKNERVAPARVNSGFFAAMAEQGDVTGVFAGHDHTNDYWGCLHGIRLCYGRVTGDNEGGIVKRGARVVRLTAGERDFATWIREDDGFVIREQPAHQPEYVGKGHYF